MPVSAQRKMLFTSWKLGWTASAIYQTSIFLDNRWQNGREMPRDAGFFCRTDYGGSEGIYLDMFLESYEDSQRGQTFMTGKTLGESGADMDRIVPHFLCDHESVPR